MATIMFAQAEMSRAHERLFAHMQLLEDDPFLLHITKNLTTADTLDCVDSSDRVSAADKGATWFQLSIIFTFISVVSLSFVSLAILSDKRVKTHPNNIIAYICLCDAYTFCQFLNRYIICGYTLNIYFERLFSWTFLVPYYTIVVKWLGTDIDARNGSGQITWTYLQNYADENHYWYGAVAIRLQFWYIMSIAISYMSLFLSLSTVLDLYLVLKSPFSSSEKRIKKFVMISMILSLVFAIIGLRMSRSKKYWVSEINFRFYQGVAVANLLISVVVMVLVILRFRKKKMNVAIQKEI